MRRAVLPLLGILFTTLLFLPVVQANSDEVSRRVEQTSDYFVVVDAPLTFTARTQLCDEPAVLWCARPDQGGHFLDSALWLYDQAGLMIAVSDDDGISYASLISIALEPGVYRLRAGRYGPCDSTGCMHPEQPFPAGAYYELLTSLPLILDPTPPQGSPEPIPSDLPTAEPSPTETPSVEPSPTVEPSPSETATPEPTPTETPSPTPTETPTPLPSVQPSPSLTPSPSPTPVPPTPTATPTETPTETLTPEPSPIESVTPEPSATPAPSPVPDNAGEVIGAAAEAVAEAVGEAVAAVTETIAAAVDRVANLGKDLTPAQKQEAAPVAVAVIISQVAGAAVAAATSSAAKGKSK